MIIIHGNRKELKIKILEYCMQNFEQEEIWLIDTLQIFDPYHLSKINTKKARELLTKIKVTRPFTIYQLRDKLFSFKKIRLHKNSTVIISCSNCFNKEIQIKEELVALKRLITSLVNGIEHKYECRFIIGKWEGQSNQQGMKLMHS